MKLRKALSGVGLAATLALSLVSPPVAGAQVDLPELPELPVLTLEQVLDIIKVDLPPDGVTLTVNIDWPAEAPLELGGLLWQNITVQVTPEGQVTILSAQPAQSGGSGGDSPGECADQMFLPTGPRWPGSAMPVRWKLRQGSIPDYLDVAKTRQAMKTAHEAWPQLKTECDYNQSNGFGFEFAGKTSNAVGYDGVHMVDFGALGDDALAITSVWATNNIVEVDTRFNTKYRWSNTAHAKRYNVLNVASHEMGHQVGLDDLGSTHGKLTMFGRISKGERSKASLGVGDLEGARGVSP